MADEANPYSEATQFTASTPFPARPKTIAFAAVGEILAQSLIFPGLYISGAMRNVGAPFAIVVLAVFALILALLLFVRRGANWARVCLVLFNVLSVASRARFFLVLIQGRPESALIVLAQGLAELAVIVLLLVPPSNSWFKQVRQMHKAGL